MSYFLQELEFKIETVKSWVTGKGIKLRAIQPGEYVLLNSRASITYKCNNTYKIGCILYDIMKFINKE